MAADAKRSAQPTAFKNMNPITVIATVIAQAEIVGFEGPLNRLPLTVPAKSKAPPSPRLPHAAPRAA